MKKLQDLSAQIKKCKKCRLYKTRKRAVPGEGPAGAKFMFVSLGPGKTENETGRPFVGRAGKYLDKLLEKNGIDRKKCFIASVIKCYLPDNKPKQDEIDACHNYLVQQIELVNPKIIICLGNVAKKEIMKTKLKQKIIYTYHPAAGLRFHRFKEKIEKDFKHLKNIL